MLKNSKELRVLKYILPILLCVQHFFSPIKESDEEMGNMVETAILAQWMHREKLNLTYARWKEGRKKEK